ncbi:alpha/beta fold hydrolase [Saccharospirillum mangrovi]|uniref:alpha/beta fold hydrolase n=1 Tax=Saccharospirillum mangrovi TaxID=2161747 RepID=UPI000D397EC6|nr:alpha/beta hydrolase [Saccharospirillum mangrovi]
MNNPSDFPKATLVSVNNITLEVFEAGKENAGNLVVLCHGWPELAYTWKEQIPALVAAGYHVIAPNQRGFGNSSCPSEVTAYDLEHLTGDLAALLDHYGYNEAVFIGHDWGAMVVWGLALLHPTRVSKIVNLSVPYMDRGDMPWIDMLETILGPDYYMVDFNRKPGVADAVLEANTENFLRNLYRKNEPMAAPAPGNMMVNLAEADSAAGESLLNDEDLTVFVEAFKKSGFTSNINWYRNLDRNWHLLANVDPIIQKPALMIYGSRDMIQPSPTLANSVPKVEVVTLDCGHWISQEKPEETNQVIVSWLEKN